MVIEYAYYYILLITITVGTSGDAVYVTLDRAVAQVFTLCGSGNDAHSSQLLSCNVRIYA